MERKPRSSFLRLLSEPGFNFTPYFDKAVIEWLERNMRDFLKEAPEACIYFTKEDDFRSIVAEHIQIIPENEKLITDFMREFNTGWESTTAFGYLMPRLIEAGKADMALNSIETFRTVQDAQIIVMAMSADGIRTLAERLDWSHLRWNSDSRSALIKRLPLDLVMQIDPERWSWYDEATIPQAVSILATVWPIANIAEFLQKYGTRFPALRCLNCGTKTAKSKPGYTLHRKSCAPNNEYPNLWNIIAERAL